MDLLSKSTYRPEECAELLNVGLNTVLNWMRHRKLPTIQTPHGPRIPREAIASHLTAQRRHTEYFKRFSAR